MFVASMPIIKVWSIKPNQPLLKIIARWVACCLLIAGLGGCTGAVRGGPDSTMNSKSDAMTAAGKELVASGDATSRNKAINKRLIIIDQAYAQYVTNLRISKTKADVATGLGALAFGIAGTLVDSVAAKTNYAAGGTLLAGSAGLIDKTLYYEQTVLALVAAMDASRSSIRLQIYRSLEKDTTEYTSSMAYQDLISYERAGTLLSAIAYVQSTSKRDQDVTEEEIRNIAKLTPDQRQQKACASRSLFSSNKQRTRARLSAAVVTLGVNAGDSGASDEELAAKLRQLNRDATPAQVGEIYGALKKVGLISSCP